MPHLYEQIVELIAPAIGKNMAGAAIKTNCKKMGITPEELSSSHIDEFINNLIPGLNVFAGLEFSGKITEKIREIK